jgi:ABC-type Fe3+ transport system substrate-binding protein
LLKSKDVPSSIFDLVKKKYSGRFAVANPLFGSTSFHFAAIFSYLGDFEKIWDGQSGTGFVPTEDDIYKKLLLNTPQLCCGDENSIAEGEKVWYRYWV